MTYGEIKDAVNALGGNHTDLASVFPNLDHRGDSRFLSILTRAMSEINLIRPRTSSGEIFCRAPKTLFAFSEPQPVDGEMEVPILGGKAVTFEYKGTGSFVSVDGNEYQLEDSPYEFERMRLTIPADLADKVITIKAKHMLTVGNLAVYGELISDSAEDIPKYSDRMVYAVESKDFVALSADSISLDDVKKYDVRIHDNRYISVPWSTTASIPVKYNRKINAVELGVKDTTELDIDDDLARALLPSLVASYAFFDPTDSASVYFRQIYEADRAVLVSKIRNADASRIYTTNNW